MWTSRDASETSSIELAEQPPTEEKCAPVSAEHAEISISAIGGGKGTSVREENAKNSELGDDALKHKISNATAYAVIVGTVVGSGIFASPGIVLAHAGSRMAAIAIWILCGAVSYMGAMCYAELGAALPDSGGEVVYLERIYGSLASFLFSWTNAVVTRPASLAIIATVFGEYVCLLLWPSSSDPKSLPEVFTKLTAITSIFAVTALNALSVRSGMLLQRITTLLKVIALGLIVVSGLVISLSGAVDDGDPGVNSSLTPVSEGAAVWLSSTTSSFGDIALAFQAGLWSFDGWNNLNYAVGEMRSPERLPAVISASTATIAILYVLVNIAYFSVLPITTVANSNAVGIQYGRAVLGGDLGAGIIALAVAMSTLGALNGSTFSGSRLVHTASQKDHLPRCLACVSKRTKSPIRALICQASIAISLVAIGDFESLVDYFSSAAWVFYVCTVAGVLLLRRNEKNLDRPYKVWIPTPVLFCTFGCTLVIGPIVVQPVSTLVSVGFVVAGIPVWWWRVRKHGHGGEDYGDKDTSSKSAPNGAEQTRHRLVRKMKSKKYDKLRGEDDEG